MPPNVSVSRNNVFLLPEPFCIRSKAAECYRYHLSLSERPCQPLSIDNSNITHLMGVYNDSVLITTDHCNQGYHLMNNATYYYSRCNGTGFWDPVIHCTGISPVIVATLYTYISIISSILWVCNLTLVFVFTALPCPPLSVSHSNISDYPGFVDDPAVVMACDIGYELSSRNGSIHLFHCLKNQTWSDSSITCQSKHWLYYWSACTSWMITLYLWI